MLRPDFLPSSLNSLLPFALDYSSSPPVSVFGTVLTDSRYEAFLGNLNQQNCPLSPEDFSFNLSSFQRIFQSELTCCSNAKSIKHFAYQIPSLPS
jgi:hypothetical protein